MDSCVDEKRKPLRGNGGMLTPNKAPHSALVGGYLLRGEQVAWGLGQDLFDVGAGGFEDANGVSNWTLYGTNTIEVSADIAYEGAKSAKITYDSDSRGAYLLLQDAKDLRSNLTIGKKYRVRLRAAVNTGSSVQVHVYDGINSLNMSTITSTTMVPVTYDFIAWNAANCSLRMAGMGAGEIIYIDDISIQEIEEGDLFDLEAGGYETNAGSWAVFGTNTVEASTDIAHSGSKSMKCTYVDDAFGAQLYLRDSFDLFTDLTIGKKYRLEFYYAVGAGDNLNIVIDYVTASFTESGVTNTTMLKGSWDFIAGHTTNCRIYFTGMGAGEVVYIDDITIQELYTPDMSGRANPAFVDGATATPWGYDFATDDLITVPNNAAHNFGSGDFTIMQKIKANNVSALGWTVSKGAGGAGGKRYGVAFNADGTLVVEIDDNTTAKTVTSLLAYDDNIDHIVTVVRQGTNLRMYIEESEDPNSPTDIGAYGDIDDATVDLVFGRFSASAANFLTGSIRWVRLYNQALSQREILEEIRRLKHESLSLSLVA